MTEAAVGSAFRQATCSRQWPSCESRPPDWPSRLHAHTVSRESPEVQNLNPHSVTWPHVVWYMGVSGSLLSPFVYIPQCAHLNPGWEGFLCLYLHCFAPAVHSAEFLINFPSCFCFSLLSTLLGNFLPLSLSRCHAGCFPSPQRVTRCLIVLFSRLSSPSRQRPH